MCALTVQRKGYKEEYMRREGLIFIYRTTINPGVSGVSHLHKINSETILVISGRGILNLNGKTININPGETHTIEPGVLHKIENPQEASEPLVLEQTKKCIDYHDFFIVA